MNDFEAALKALPKAVAEMKALNARVDLNRGIVELTAAEVAARPYLIRNAFVAVIGGTLPYDRMTDLQRATHLAFRYDGEVQNGGHLQFFLNTRASGRDSSTRSKNSRSLHRLNYFEPRTTDGRAGLVPSLQLPRSSSH